jgi:fucose 4-O-acetylase-like acetyltransferase
MPFGESFPVAECIRNSLGQIGVAVFFILSGFFYKRSKGDTVSFWKKKVKGIIVPWIIFSVLSFAFSLILNRDFTDLPVRLFKWVFGIGTWFWYVPMLLILYALFKFVKSDVLLYVALAVTAVSVMLTAFGFVKQTEYFSQYTNLLDWIGFFALGILLRKNNLLDKLTGVLPFICGLAVLSVSVSFAVLLNQNKAYVNYFSILTELSGALVLLNVSALLHKSKLLADIGKKSYFIYLVQMQPAGIVNTRLPYNTLFFILRPFIVLLTLYAAAKLIEYVLKKIKLSKYAYIFALK